MSASPSTTQSDSTISVLLVEDSASDASLVRHMLDQARFDYCISVAARLDEAIALVEQQSFDVVLLDLTLPDSDGLETIDAFMSAAARLPTIVLTIIDDESIALDAIMQGAQDYLVKDELSAEMLVRAIRYSIERGQLLCHIQDANRELEAFSYSAAHELKSPLRSIIGFIDILLNSSYGGTTLDETAASYIQSIRDTAVQMN